MPRTFVWHPTKGPKTTPKDEAVTMGRVRIERWFDPSDRSFNKRITIGERRYLERVRGYDLAEISAMFTSSGLAIANAFGDFDSAPFEASSPRLILVGRRSGL